MRVSTSILTLEKKSDCVNWKSGRFSMSVQKWTSQNSGKKKLPDKFD